MIKTLLCGGLAGITAKTIIAPFDRVKIHFQVENPALLEYSGRLTGVFKALDSIWKSSGIIGIYRGHSAMLLRIFPYAAINFLSYEYLKDLLYLGKIRPEEVAWWRRLLAGSLSGAIAVAATYPLDIIRARLAFDLSPKVFPRSDKISFKSISSSYCQSVRRVLASLSREGRQIAGISFAGYYQGFCATLAGIIPYAGVSYFSFETMKSLYRRNHHSTTRESDFKSIEPIPVAVKLPMGMLSGALAQTAAYPLDIIRRRTQLLSVAPHLHSVHFKDEQNIKKMLLTLIKTRGLRSLFVGLSINYLKVAPATGISFVVYEYLRERVFHLDIR